MLQNARERAIVLQTDETVHPNLSWPRCLPFFCSHRGTQHERLRNIKSGRSGPQNLGRVYQDKNGYSADIHSFVSPEIPRNLAFILQPQLHCAKRAGIFLAIVAVVVVAQKRHQPYLRTNLLERKTETPCAMLPVDTIEIFFFSPPFPSHSNNPSVTRISARRL